jgi:hypothetical protein
MEKLCIGSHYVERQHLRLAVNSHKSKQDVTMHTLASYQRLSNQILFYASNVLQASADQAEMRQRLAAIEQELATAQHEKTPLLDTLGRAQSNEAAARSEVEKLKGLMASWQAGQNAEAIDVAGDDQHARDWALRSAEMPAAEQVDIEHVPGGLDIQQEAAEPEELPVSREQNIEHACFQWIQMDVMWILNHNLCVSHNLVTLNTSENVKQSKAYAMEHDRGIELFIPTTYQSLLTSRPWRKAISTVKCCPCVMPH